MRNAVWRRKAGCKAWGVGGPRAWLVHWNALHAERSSGVSSTHNMGFTQHASKTRGWNAEPARPVWCEAAAYPAWIFGSNEEVRAGYSAMAADFGARLGRARP